MLNEKFFLNNIVYWGGDRMVSLKDFETICNGYLIHEHQGVSMDNTLYLTPFDGEGRVRIFLSGSNNTFRIGKKNRIDADFHVDYAGIFGRRPGHVTIEIGEKNFFHGRIMFKSPVWDNRCIHVGNHNLFAPDVYFMGRNDHGIFDKLTHKQYNEDSDVILGDRNWVCKNVEFYPRTIVRNDCVIATHSLVNHEFNEDNVLLAGIPAIVKRKNIIWSVYCETARLEQNLSNPLHTARPD